MQKKVREGVFETNSSSTHSLTVNQGSADSYEWDFAAKITYDNYYSSDSLTHYKNIFDNLFKKKFDSYSELIKEIVNLF